MYNNHAACKAVAYYTLYIINYKLKQLWLKN
jgi:hypothetical protein